MKTKLNDLFDQMDEEKGNKLDDKIKLEKTEPTILEKIYENYLCFEGQYYGDASNCEKVVLKEVSAKDITNFSMRLDPLLDKITTDPLGRYISLLINYSNDKNHYLFFERGGKDLIEIGYKNKGKQIYVKGDNIRSIGRDMKSGKIIVDGNTNSNVGNKMTGGKIIVKGNPGYSVGANMLGGKIIVSGKVINQLHYLSYVTNEKGETIITREKY